MALNTGNIAGAMSCDNGSLPLPRFIVVSAERTVSELVLSGGTFTDDRWACWAAQKGERYSN
eukprot:6429471-Amphidinium_carterae.1